MGEFSFTGEKQKSNPIKYKFRNFSPDLPEAEQRKMIASSMHTWSEHADIDFEEVFSGEDLHILFAQGEHPEDNYAFDGTGQVVAHANGMFVHFDEDENWGDPRFLYKVSLHELGHSLGLSHSGDREAIMYPYVGEKRNTLNHDDIAGIQELYGKKEGKPQTPLPSTPSSTKKGPSGGTSSGELF